MTRRFIYCFIFLLSIIHILSCSCRKGDTSNQYKEVTESLYDLCYKNEKEKFSKDEVNTLFNILKNNKVDKDKGQKIKLIKWENIKNVKDIDLNISELKRQIKFIENISYIYILDFFFRLLGDQKYINFMLTVNGVGGPVLESAGYVNLEIGDILCNGKNCSKTIDMECVYSPEIEKGSKTIFTNVPIYDINNNKIYSNNKNTLKLFSGSFIDLKDNIKNRKLTYFYSICEYLSQMGNPLFAICDGFEYEISSIYNSLILLSSIFENLPFFKKIGNKIIKNHDVRRSGQIEKLEGSEIYKEIEQLGAAKEQNMIMLAEVIVMNNLLYYIFRSAKIKNKVPIVNLAFSSYGGRVFEMFISLLKNDYSNLSDVVSEDECVIIEKNSINTTLIHGLIGSNDIKNDGGNSFLNLNKEKIFKDIGNKIISRDRLKYFNCDNIFGNSFESLLQYYNENINERKINQIISKFTENRSNSFLKNMVRWEFDGILTSFYNSKHNDGMLSQDGLFVYNNNIHRNEITDIISNNISNPTKNAEYKIVKSNLEKTDYSYNVNSKNGFFIIEDENIRYIHVGGGSHICTDVKETPNSYSIYEDRGRFLEKLLKDIYD